MTPANLVRFADGALDLALLSPPIQPHLTELESAALPPATLLMAVPADDPIAQQGAIKLDRLKGQTLITGSLMPESGFYIQLMSLLGKLRADVTLRDGIYPTTMIANMVGAGLGWSLVTEDSVDRGRADVALVPIRGVTEKLQRALVWRTAALTPAAGKLVQQLTAAL